MELTALDIPALTLESLFFKSLGRGVNETFDLTLVLEDSAWP